MDNNKLTINDLIEAQENFNTTEKINLSNGSYLNIKPYLDKNDMDKIISDYSNFLLDKEVNKIIKNNEIFIFLQCFVILNNSDLTDNAQLNSNIDKLKFCTLLSNNIVLLDEIISKFEVRSIELIISKFRDIIKVAEKVKKYKEIKNKNKNKNKKKKK